MSGLGRRRGWQFDHLHPGLRFLVSSLALSEEVPGSVVAARFPRGRVMPAAHHLHRARRTPPSTPQPQHQRDLAQDRGIWLRGRVSWSHAGEQGLERDEANVWDAKGCRTVKMWGFCTLKSPGGIVHGSQLFIEGVIAMWLIPFPGRGCFSYPVIYLYIFFSIYVSSAQSWKSEIQKLRRGLGFV